MSEKEAKPWDLINPDIPHVSKEIRELRLSICRSCDKFVNLTQQCSVCHCIMPLKTRLPHAWCPEQKWSSADIEEEDN
jgi:hypothetical protein